MPRCNAFTKKKVRCPNHADAIDSEGNWLCHVHHPTMLYRLQVKARHNDMEVVRGEATPRPRRSQKGPEYDRELDELRRKLGLST